MTWAVLVLFRDTWLGATVAPAGDDGVVPPAAAASFDLRGFMVVRYDGSLDDLDNEALLDGIVDLAVSRLTGAGGVIRWAVGPGVEVVYADRDDLRRHYEVKATVDADRAGVTLSALGTTASAGWWAHSGLFTYGMLP